MSVIARFELIPIADGSMSDEIAQSLRALDRHPVSYRTTATDTIIEADTVDQVFEAVKAAHKAVPEDRVITSVEIDEDRRRPQDMNQRVASVERALGHPPERQQRFETGGSQRAGTAGSGPSQSGQARQSPQSSSGFGGQPGSAQQTAPPPQQSTGGTYGSERGTQGSATRSPQSQPRH